MGLKIKLIALRARMSLEAAFSVSLLIGALSTPATGRTVFHAQPDELYAGIELCAEGVKVVALRVFSNDEKPGDKLVYSEFVHLPLGSISRQETTSEIAGEAALAVQKLLTRLRQQYQVPDERIYLIGSSQFGADQKECLASAISETTGKTLTFLNAAIEFQLSIVGTIPQREKIDGAWIDNRNTSVLIEIGTFSTRGGYQFLRHLPIAPPRYEFISMNIPRGAVSLAAEIDLAVGKTDNLSAVIQLTREVCATSFSEALRRARESKPGLLNRRRVYLTGDIVRALAILLYPEDRRIFVPLTEADIALFGRKAAHDPRALLNPNLSQIRSRELRQEIEGELQSVRNTFTHGQLIAGAEMLKTVAGEFNWREKKIWFARFGHLGCLLTYVHLQAER